MPLLENNSKLLPNSLYQVLFILTITLLLNGCLKDDYYIISSGNRLDKISYEENGVSWEEKFGYFDDEMLSEVENSRSLGRRYEVTYENSRVSEIKTFRVDIETLIFRDEYFYDEDGNIVFHKNYSINSGDTLPLSRIDTFKYDEFSRVIEQVSFSNFRNETSSVRKFYWDDNNIVREEYFHGEGDVRYEYFYTYDDKVNYKKGLGIYLYDPLNWSDNNITSMNWNDYVGNLDMYCRPCDNYYTYNEKGLPAIIEQDWGRTIVLTYK